MSGDPSGEATGKRPRNSTGVVSHGLLQRKCIAVAPHSRKAALVVRRITEDDTTQKNRRVRCGISTSRWAQPLAPRASQSHQPQSIKKPAQEGQRPPSQSQQAGRQARCAGPSSSMPRKGQRPPSQWRQAGRQARGAGPPQPVKQHAQERAEATVAVAAGGDDPLMSIISESGSQLQEFASSSTNSTKPPTSPASGTPSGSVTLLPRACAGGPSGTHRGGGAEAPGPSAAHN